MIISVKVCLCILFTGEHQGDLSKLTRCRSHLPDIKASEMVYGDILCVCLRQHGECDSSFGPFQNANGFLVCDAL